MHSINPWLLLAWLCSACWLSALGQTPDAGSVGDILGSIGGNDAAIINNAAIDACERLRAENYPGVSDLCGWRWALRNSVRIPEFWEVHELEFYWDRFCTLPLAKNNPISSQTNTGFQLHTPDKMVDGNLATKWTANCRALLGGCEPYTTYVGLNTGSGMGVNTEAHEQYASVRCLRIYQSENISRQSLSMDLGLFTNDSELSFYTLAHYSEFAGGRWQYRPGFEAGIWRLRNTVSTSRPWQVAELLLYSDRFCVNEQLHGVPIASGSFLPSGCVFSQSCDQFLPGNAFDGERRPGHPYPDPLPTYWQADCHKFSGCSAREAWIGMDYGLQPVTVQCLRIFQPTHPGYPEFGFPTYASSVLLEYWDGYTWKENDNMFNLGHGGWNETQPMAGYAWRLSNFDLILDSWRVAELQLFTSRTCGELGDQQKELGLPVDSNPKLPFSEQEIECRLDVGSCGDLTHDRNVGTSWQSSCTACQQGEAWVGLLFSARPREIQCFRLIQSGEYRYRTESVELSVWAGTSWEVRRFETGVGGGTWNFRPTSPLSAWRFLATSDTQMPWAVLNIAFFSDSSCNQEITAPEIGSGGQPTRRVDHAFDHDNSTYFEASCPPTDSTSEGCMPGSTWLGRQAGSGLLDVHCVQLQQHRLRVHQASLAVLQHFDGLRWVPNPRFDPVRDFGGGTWQSFPGRYASMWRLRSETVLGGAGVGVAEMQFHRNSDCTANIEVSHPNVVPISSGFATSREVSDATGATAHFVTMGVFGQAYPARAFDGDLATFWAELEGRPTSVWLGLDLNTQVADVQCVKLAFAGIRALQPSWSWVEAWDGSAWSAMAVSGPNNLPGLLRFPVLSPGGAGWQDRPAALQSMWRLQNTVDQEAWEVSEVELFISTDCSGNKLTGQPIASALTTPVGEEDGGHRLPARAFDGSLETFWAADCTFEGCRAGNAWIGLELPTPALVRCLRMAQGGTARTQASTAMLAVWNGNGWEESSILTGLGGGTWNLRPAMPDTMWRVVFVERQDEPCNAFTTFPYRRSWGVSELEFFADDDCQVRLPLPSEGAEGAQPIASGMRVPPSVGRGILLDSFAPTKAFDGSTETYWAAQCASEGREEANCMAGHEWIGLDWGKVTKGMPVEVRCVRIHQSRSIASECCDPASKIALERWNGTSWVEAVWRHLPRERGALHIEGEFTGMGRCPAITEHISRNVDLWETRTRRQSETCAVPLSGAVPLLTDKLCEKHPGCAAAGFVGACCPVSASSATACDEQGFEAGHCSRCCCDVITEKIFEDELQLDVGRNPIDEAPIAGLELIAIRTINVMPWIGLVITLLIYVAANTPKPPLETGCCARLWLVFCYPVHAWMAQGGLVGSTFAWLCRRNPGERPWVVRSKRLLILAAGIIVGSYFLWILISVLVAELILKVVLLLSVVIRFAKSPFNPLDLGDRTRFQLVLAAPFPSSESAWRAPSLGDLIKGLADAFAQAVVSCVKGVLDIILVRFSLMALNADFATVQIPDILLQIPALPVDVSGLTRDLYALTKIFTDAFMEIVVQLFQGIPRCEGPVLIFSGISLLVITLVLIRCLNFDFFGLLVATKNTAKTTRPFFQKILFVVSTIAIQTGIFVAMQCTMLIFARALMLVDFNGEHWMCPYVGEGISTLSGRVFLVLTAVLASAIIFLSANGHFMGQQQLTLEFSERIKVDLRRLDPDGTTGLIRTSFCLSMIPTTLGIWIDGWNVRGFLVKERATVYASELKYPQVCPHCGVAHVPYWEMMKVTGMQLSLSYQWFPFGVVIGKACEYLNNPPLLYLGKDLACMNVAENVIRAREGIPKKMNAKRAATFYAGLVVAHIKDHVLPFLCKVLAVCVYCTLIICTYIIDRDNIQDVGYWMFALLMSFASAKAVVELFLPLVMVFILAAILVITQRRAQNADKREEARMLKPFFGQLAHSVPVGMSVAIYLLENTEGSRDMDTLIGCAAGAFSGMLVMCIALVLEQCPASHLAGRLFIGTYGCAIAIGVGRLGAHHLPTDQRYVVMAFLALFLVPISAVAFSLPPLNPDRIREASAVLPMLKTARLFACAYGSLAGVFVGSYWHADVAKRVKEDLWNRWGGVCALLVCAFLGYCVGLAYTFVTDSVVKRRAGQWALLVGTALTIVFGLTVSWLVGVVIGSVVATILGAILEHFQMRALQATCFEPLRFTDSKVAGIPLSQDADAASPPTVMKAWMPSSNGVEGLVLATTGLSQSVAVAETEAMALAPQATPPQAKVKKYTMGRNKINPPLPPRDPWAETVQETTMQALPPTQLPQEATVPPAGPQHPALRAQVMPAAGLAQLAAMGIGGGGSGTGSAASSARGAARHAAGRRHGPRSSSAEGE